MKKPPLVLACAALLICVTSGYAVAQSATDSASKKLSACATKKGGALRLASKCKKSEKKVTWASAGPAGPQGTAGAGGPAGSDGTNGAAGAAGAPGSDGTNGKDGTDGTPGTNGNSTGETFYQLGGGGSNFGFSGCNTTPSGPSVTFTAPAGSYVQVMASVGMQRSSATANNVCLHVDSDDINILSSTSLAVDTRYLQQGSAAGVTDHYQAQPISFPVSAGSHTVSLRYGSTGGTSSFTSPKLYVTVFHPTS